MMDLFDCSLLVVRLFRLGQVCDELDFVPMDEFQKQFFLLRQDEWLEYKQNFPRYVGEELTARLVFVLRNAMLLFCATTHFRSVRHPVLVQPGIRVPVVHIGMYRTRYDSYPVYVSGEPWYEYVRVKQCCTGLLGQYRLA